MPKGRYELAEVQLEATRTALSAQTGGCYEEQSKRDAEIRSLEDEKARLEERVHDLGDQVASLDAALTAARSAAAVEQTEQLAAALAALEDAEARAQRRSDEIGEVQAALQPLGDRVQVRVGPGGVRVELPWEKMFQPGIAGLTPWGEQMAEDLAKALAALPGRRIRVEGHVDDPAFHSAEFPSAWELGFGRAMLVLRAMRDHGMALPAFASSYGEPLAGDPDASTRVDVVIALRTDL